MRLADKTKYGLFREAGVKEVQPMKKQRLSKHMPYIFVGIPILILISIGLYPFIYSIWISLHWWPLVEYRPPYFVGAKNYVDLVTSNFFPSVLQTTAIYVLGSVGLEFLLGLGLALLMQSENRFFTYSRSLFTIPILIAPVAVGLIWRFLYNPLYGPLTMILQNLGFFVDFQDKSIALFSIIIADVWQWMPFMFLVLLSALLYVPKDQYEAAEVDGVNTWQRFRYVTLPWLKNIIVILLLLRGTVCFGEMDKIYVITRGGPGRITQTLVYQSYETGFQMFQIGEATAVGFFILLLVNIFYVVLVKVLRE